MTSLTHLIPASENLGVASVEQALRRVWVQVLNGRQEGRSYSLGRGVSSFGLNEHATVGLFGDPSVARSHAEIEISTSGVTLKNLDVDGRTKRNGQPMAGSSPLQDGDTFELGGTRLIFRNRG